MAVPAMTANDPDLGSISWAPFNMRHAGVAYEIPGGSTSERWVWWRYTETGGLLEQGANVPLDLTDSDVVLFANQNGTPIRVQSTKLIDGDLLVDGSVTTRALSATAITAEMLLVNNALVTGILEVNTTIAKAIETAGIAIGDQTWDTTNGFVIPGVVTFPYNKVGEALIRAHTVARSLVIENFFKLQGKTNEISEGATLVVADGVTAPTLAPQVETYYSVGRTLALENADASRGYAVRYGADTPGVYVATAATSSTVAGTISKYSASDGSLIKRSSMRAAGTTRCPDPRGGLTLVEIGGVQCVMVLCYEPTDNKWWLYQMNTDLTLINKSTALDIKFTHDPAIGVWNNSLGVVVAVGVVQDGAAKRLKAFLLEAANPISGVYETIDYGTSYIRHIAGYAAATWVPGQSTSSPTRAVIWSRNADPQVWSSGSSNPVQYTETEGFPLAPGQSLRGVSSNTALNSAGQVVTYNITKFDPATEIAYSFYDSDTSVVDGGSGHHETGLSPAVTLADIPRGGAFRVTPTPPPYTGDNDSPNISAVYARLPGGLWRQISGYIDGTQYIDSIHSSIGTAGVVHGTRPTFATAGNKPGRIYSTGFLGPDPAWYLDGDGSGRMGPWRWDKFGEVLEAPEPVREKKLQSGTKATGTMVATVDTDLAIVFDVPFTELPVIQALPQFGTTAGGGLSVTTQAPTLTGVTINVRRATGTAAVTVHWYAHGYID